MYERGYCLLNSKKGNLMFVLLREVMFHKCSFTLINDQL